LVIVQAILIRWRRSVWRSRYLSKYKAHRARRSFR